MHQQELLAYCGMLAHAHRHEDAPLRRYLDGLGMWLSGNEAWSVATTRYACGDDVSTHAENDTILISPASPATHAGEHLLDTITAINAVAEDLHVRGDVASARALHEQAVAALGRALGDDRPDHLGSIDHLAELHTQVDLAAARELQKQALGERSARRATSATADPART
jgi:hypothetical protein